MNTDYLKSAICLIEKAMGHKADAEDEKMYDDDDKGMEYGAEKPEMKNSKPSPVIAAIFGKKKSPR